MTRSRVRVRWAPLGAAMAALLGCVVIGVNPATAHAASSRQIVGPSGSQAFGADVLVLTNGNFVVVDSLFDSPTQIDIGAVYLYDGATDQLISTVTGSTAGDAVGSGGLKEVGTSDFVIVSPLWDNDLVLDAGAVTWVNGATGLNGDVAATNSLVGATNNDKVGSDGVTALTNGSYVVDSSFWDGTVLDAGAVTWVNGAAGTIGPVAAGNSLVGATAGDRVGSDGVTALTNGSYVVDSSLWANGAVPNTGAVTWGSGDSGISGKVTLTNSLVGTAAGDGVGSDGVTALTTGNYVVDSSLWANGAIPNTGAVTWGSGGTGISGAVAPGNSLVGNSANDSVGIDGVTALTNGNYVVDSSLWDNGAVTDAGAVTWGNGAGGTVGVVGSGNSLVGTTINDFVGTDHSGGSGVTALTNGNYVVDSADWDNALVVDVGAVTWGNGDVGTIGPVGSGNSLVGTTANDNVGSGGVTALTSALTSGDYVVDSPFWDSAVANVGAVTWASGTAVTSSPVGSGNSLVGTTANDFVGIDGVTALTNGNYVVASSLWDNVAGTVNDAGAVTWASGTAVTSSPVGSGNSLVGTTALDSVGSDGVTALTNGNYVVDSSGWHNGTAVARAGAVTWGNGAGPTVGPVSSGNSLVGSTSDDFVGTTNVGSGVIALTSGDYVVVSASWDNGAAIDAGAATYGPVGGISGTITATNSAMGTPPGLVLSAGKRLTSDDAIVVSTEQDRVLLLRVGAQSPVFGSTPSNITVPAALGAATAAVNYAVPVATGRGGTPSVVCSPAPGTLFPIGATLVACAATDIAGFIATASFTVTVTATTPVPDPVPAPAPAPTPAPAPVPVPVAVSTQDYVPLEPARLADTRPEGATSDTLFAGGGIRSVGSTLELTVAGRGGVAADATAVALNVTAVEPTGSGFVTVYPCGSVQPTASNLNYSAGAVVPNAVVAKIGAGGMVCVFVSAATHLVVDVEGYFPTASTLHSINPARVLETRPALPTIDSSQEGGGLRAAASVTAVQITNRATVSADAVAVVLNITITDAQASGFATVYPCGIAVPTASNINYVAGSTVANLVVSKVGVGGGVCIYTQSATDLIADVNGYFPAVTTYQPLDPARLLETRPGEATSDGQSRGAGLRPSGTITEVAVTGRGGVPAAAASVVLNVTATDTTAPGFVTVYPCGITRPLASNLNYDTGTTVANAVSVKVGTGGKICLFNSSPTQLIADVNGYLPN